MRKANFRSMAGKLDYTAEFKKSNRLCLVRNTLFAFGISTMLVASCLTSIPAAVITSASGFLLVILAYIINMAENTRIKKDHRRSANTAVTKKNITPSL